MTMTDSKSPCKFTTDGYQLVVMPMMTADSKPPAEPEAEAKPEAEPAPEVENAEVGEAIAEAEAITEAEAEDTEVTEAIAEPEAKPKRKHKALVQKPRAEAKEPVAVA